MVVVPTATPVTIPATDPMLATEGVLENHKPPVLASVNAIVEPVHNADGPTIGAGVGFMVTTAVT